MDLVDEQYTDGLSAITEVELYENGSSPIGTAWWKAMTTR